MTLSISGDTTYSIVSSSRIASSKTGVSPGLPPTTVPESSLESLPPEPDDELPPPPQLAKLYRCRWQVELFFKWIKQHLRIKKFFGVSENAVKTQVWIAVSVYVLVAIIKKRRGIDRSLYEILQILSIALFEKMPVLQAFAGNEAKISEGEVCNQLELFD